MGSTNQYSFRNPFADSCEVMKSNEKEKLEAEENSEEDMEYDILDHTLLSDRMMDLLVDKYYNEKQYFQGDDRSVTYEEFRERPRRELDEFGAGRNCAIPEEKAKKRDDRDARRGYGDKKRKRDSAIEESEVTPDELVEEVKKDAAEASKELVLGHVKLSNDELKGKKRKVSKYKKLERAMNRGSGIKVHDDPKLIQKSMQKGKKKKQTNAEKWMDRIQTRIKLKAEKQQKRAKIKADWSHDKKVRKICKEREKAYASWP